MSGGAQNGAQEQASNCCRWLPRSLNRQLFLFTALALGVAILGYAAYSANRQSQMADNMMAAQMAALAASLAEVSISPVVTGELDAIEEVLMQSIRFPGVLSILVTDEKGRPLSEMLNRHGKIMPRYSSENIHLPSATTMSQHADDELFASWRLIFDTRSEKTVWRPISGGSTLGWVRVTYSLEETRGIILRVWASALLFSSLAIGAALFLLMFMLRAPMRALAAATQFAARLDRSLGEQMPVSSVAAEFEALGRALNSVSQRLKLQDEALSENAQYTRHIVDNMVDGIITIDARGTVRSFNSAAAAIFGYAPEEVIGNNIRMLMPEPYHSEHDAYLARYMNTGVPHIIGTGREVKGRRKDGSIFPMDLAVSHGTHQEQPLFIGLVRDITERKRIDEMKSEFISTVSHELRTPLTSIRGSLALIAGGVAGELPAAARPLVDIAHKNSERLILLVNDILDIEKIEAGKMEFDMRPVGLMPLVERALEDNREYAGQFGVGYVLERAVPEAMVGVDVNRLLQVLANLLSNAAKFSHPGGEVAVAVERIGGRIRIAVKDNGPGIPEEFRGRIFQKFAQADSSDTRKKGGTGLGLSITKSIVEQMGGSIGFESQPNVLTTFHVEFPEWMERRAPDISQRNSTAAYRILVCEDSRDTAAVLRAMLEQGGYVADIAYDAAQAKQLLERGGYAAMTLDLVLPGQDGLALARELRGKAGVPILVISARAAEGKQALQSEASDIVEWFEKPLGRDQLLPALERVLRQPVRARPRVLHVEDDADIFHVVRGVAHGVVDMEHAASIEEARNMLARKRYDLVILDMGLPDGAGRELLPLLKEALPPVPVLVFSAHECSMEEIRGVDAVLVKSRTTNDELLAAIKRLAGVG